MGTGLRRPEAASMRYVMIVASVTRDGGSSAPSQKKRKGDPPRAGKGTKNPHRTGARRG
jgi:hypothetical protein